MQTTINTVNNNQQQKISDDHDVNQNDSNSMISQSNISNQEPIIGEILISGPCVFKEYWKLPEETQKSFIIDAEDPTKRWFRSGDCGQLGAPDIKQILEGIKTVRRACAEGIESEQQQYSQYQIKRNKSDSGQSQSNNNAILSPDDENFNQIQHLVVDLETSVLSIPQPNHGNGDNIRSLLPNLHRILGRNSVDIIKSGGFKISALEVETVLLAHPLIKECAVIPMACTTWGEKVTAVVVMNNTSESDSDLSLSLPSLREWAKPRMATYKVPHRLEIWSELPRNQLGKLEKKKIMASLGQ